MRQKLTPEEKAVRAAAKKAEKLAEKQAALKAQIELVRQQAAEMRAKREANFRASLPPEDLADLEAAFAEEQLDHFTQSVKQQFVQRGELSANQVATILRKYRTKRELEQQAEKWPVISVGDKVRLMGKVVKVEEVQNPYFVPFKVNVPGSQPSFSITLKSSYGRTFKFKTGKQDWVDDAREAFHGNKWVKVEGKVKFLAPATGGTVVLTSRGMKFGRLL